MKTIGYAAKSSDAHMVPYHFERRNLRDNDVSIEILYSGVCHSDLHTVNGDWGDQPYPLVPGHEQDRLFYASSQQLLRVIPRGGAPGWARSGVERRSEEEARAAREAH